MFDRQVEKTIGRYGGKILSSPGFYAALKQKHHRHSDVGTHSLHVAQTGVRMHLLLEKAGISTDARSIVIGALCHDLGMLETDRKYHSNRECCRRHPIDSAKAAQQLIGTLDEKTKDAILHHMFPATKTPPASAEGFIVSIADKYVSVKDLLRSLPFRQA